MRGYQQDPAHPAQGQGLRYSPRIRRTQHKDTDSNYSPRIQRTQHRDTDSNYSPRIQRAQHVESPFQKGETLATTGTQLHLGLKNEFRHFQQNEVSLEPKPGKLQDILEALIAFRQRKDQLISLGEIMTIAGNLIFLLMRCFNKMARRGLQPFPNG